MLRITMSSTADNKSIKNRIRNNYILLIPDFLHISVKFPVPSLMGTGNKRE